MTENTKQTGTVGGPNPNTGSADAARGLGGHSKDADHGAGAPAEYVEDEQEAGTEASKKEAPL